MEKRFWKHLGVFLGGFFLAVLLLFWIVRDDWQRTAVTTEPVNRDTVLSDLVDREVTQEIKAAADRLDPAHPMTPVVRNIVYLGLPAMLRRVLSGEGPGRGRTGKEGPGSL